MSGPIFRDDIWAFAQSEQQEDISEEINESVLTFELEYLFSNWVITTPDEPNFKEFATDLIFEVPVKIEGNKLFCKSLFFIGPDNTAYFVLTSPE